MEMEISPRMALQLLNRKLSKTGKRLCESGPGLYHIIDTSTNIEEGPPIDYEGLRELCIKHGALSSDMTIAIDDK